MERSYIQSTNIPRMSAGEVTRQLSMAYGTIINKGLPVRSMPSVMLWGPPGIGKSQAVRQIAARLEEQTGKKTCVTDVRLLLFNPIDLRGIPTANEDKTLAIWLRPQIFQMDPSDEVINILFLDELSAAPQSVQAAAFQITLDRTVGEHKLPENCIVIAAGNRTTDRSVAFRMPRALANRLMHIEVEDSFESWRIWAIQAGIHEKVLGFLSFRRDHLMQFDQASDDLAFPTPRTWEMVSSLLHGVTGEVEEVYPMIAGVIGCGAAMEFLTWSRVWQDLPSMEEIFQGKTDKYPSGTDAMYALTASMTAYAREHREDLEQIACSIRYARKLPPDYGVVLLKNYLSLEKDYPKKLMTIPEFTAWLQKNGSLMNGWEA